MIAPEPYLSAYLEVAHAAVVHTRHLALESVKSACALASRERAQQIADLQDAIHVVLELLKEWERCDEPALRTYLERYDERWVRSEDDLSLVQVWSKTFESAR